MAPRTYGPDVDFSRVKRRTGVEKAENVGGRLAAQVPVLHGPGAIITDEEENRAIPAADLRRRKARSQGSDKSELGEYVVFGKEFASAIKGGNALQPTSAATTVRVRDGKLLTTEGPFAYPRPIGSPCPDNAGKSV